MDKPEEKVEETPVEESETPTENVEETTVQDGASEK